MEEIGLKFRGLFHKANSFALGHTKPAFSLFYSAFCLFSRSFSPHIMQFAYLEQNAECNDMTQKQENEAIWMGATLALTFQHFLF